MNQVYMKIYWPSSHSVFIDKKFLSYRIRIRAILESLKEWIEFRIFFFFLKFFFIKNLKNIFKFYMMICSYFNLK